MRTYLKVSGSLFALVAIGHLIRLLARSSFVLFGRPIPALASFLALVLTAAMSIWAWRLLAEVPPKAEGGH